MNEMPLLWWTSASFVEFSSKSHFTDVSWGPLSNWPCRRFFGGLSYLRGRGRRWLRLPGLAPPWIWERAVGRRWREPRRRTERWPGPTYLPGPVGERRNTVQVTDQTHVSICVRQAWRIAGYWRVCCLQWRCCWLAVAAGSAPAAVSASGPAAPDAAGTVRLWKLRETRLRYKSWSHE